MHVALAGADLDVVADEPARREPELRLLGSRHAAVEDDAGVGPAVVLLEELDNRVTADLLLPVACDADVHRQRVVGAQQLRRLEQGVELALVVGDPARVEPAVALLELERGRLPKVERRGRLHVEVPVDHHRGRAGAVAVRGDVADDEVPRALRD